MNSHSELWKIGTTDSTDCIIYDKFFKIACFFELFCSPDVINVFLNEKLKLIHFTKKRVYTN